MYKLSKCNLIKDIGESIDRFVTENKFSMARTCDH